LSIEGGFSDEDRESHKWHEDASIALSIRNSSAVQQQFIEALITNGLMAGKA
jgi:hypothetical protein